MGEGVEDMPFSSVRFGKLSVKMGRDVFSNRDVGNGEYALEGSEEIDGEVEELRLCLQSNECKSFS